MSMCDGSREAERGEVRSEGREIGQWRGWKTLRADGRGFLRVGLIVAALLIAGRAFGLSRSGEDLSAGSNQGRYADTIFGQLTQANGLPSPAVSAFTQDADGFLWIATQSGLARWDGYHFRVYQAQLGVAGTLPDNLLQAIYTDA